MIHAGRTYAQIEEQYQRRMRQAWALSATLYAAVLFLTPSALVPRFAVDHTGLLGAQRRTPDITPERTRIELQETLAAWHAAGGSMRWIEIEIVDDPVAEGPPPILAPRTPPPIPHRPLDLVAQLVPPGPTGPPMPVLEIELDEGLAAQTASRPSSHTESFAIREMLRPEYPDLSLWAQVEGLVTIRAVVDPQGSVTGVSTIDNEADIFCERAASQALMNWRFDPVRVAGEAVWFTVVVPFRFRLTE